MLREYTCPKCRHSSHLTESDSASTAAEPTCAQCGTRLDTISPASNDATEVMNHGEGSKQTATFQAVEIPPTLHMPGPGSPAQQTQPAGSPPGCSCATGAWSTCSRPTRYPLRASPPKRSAICSHSYLSSPRGSAISWFAGAERSSNSVRASSATTWTLLDSGGSAPDSILRMHQSVHGEARTSSAPGPERAVGS